METFITRPPLPGDLDFLARHIAAVAVHRRAAEARRVIAAAAEARDWRERTGRAHPDYGTGSIMAAVTGMCAGAPPPRALWDADFCRCVAIAAEALADLADAETDARSFNTRLRRATG